jgi:hypothetical protein
MNALPLLPLARYRLAFTALEPVRLPEYAGSAWHRTILHINQAVQCLGNCISTFSSSKASLIMLIYMAFTTSPYRNSALIFVRDPVNFCCDAVTNILHISSATFSPTGGFTTTLLFGGNQPRRPPPRLFYLAYLQIRQHFDSLSVAP